MFKPLRLLCAVLSCAALTSGNAQTTEWPTRPIRIIVPAPAGGPYDRTIRPLGQHLAKTLKQPVVIENRASAGNIVGTQAGATAAHDGYTLTMTGLQTAVSQSMYENVPYDIVTSFEHIGLIGEGFQWLVVRSDAGIDNFKDFVAKVKQAPGKIDYASSGAGSTGHLLMEQLQRAAGIKLTHVPYRGAAPALQDVLSGVVPVTVIPSNAAITYVQSGKFKVLAVSSPQRSPLVPAVPTFAELGFKELTMSSWVGLSAPKGTPPNIIQKVNAAMHAALADPSMLKLFEFEGLTPLSRPPEQYAQLVRTDTERWGKLVHSLNIKAN